MFFFHFIFQVQGVGVCACVSQHRMPQFAQVFSSGGGEKML